ncbi:MAG TPA: hypothetical protein VG370_05360 [Chloroflexota bacterium]|jgi:hypothetical protein|nr:hypothetical protein [Chloroflexota bacterium]
MIPPFDPATGLLPPGVHEATWEELVARFGGTPHRLVLLAGLKAALDALRAAGCRRAYVNGSFVTAKQMPGDFDGCWEVEGVDLSRLDPVLMTFANLRAAQKQKYGGELFPADAPAARDGTKFLNFFQRDRATGAPKGIVAIDLGGLP